MEKVIKIIYFSPSLASRSELAYTHLCNWQHKVIEKKNIFFRTWQNLQGDYAITRLRITLWWVFPVKKILSQNPVGSEYIKGWLVKKNVFCKGWHFSNSAIWILLHSNLFGKILLENSEMLAFFFEMTLFHLDLHVTKLSKRNSMTANSSNFIHFLKSHCPSIVFHFFWYQCEHLIIMLLR